MQASKKKAWFEKARFGKKIFLFKQPLFFERGSSQVFYEVKL